MKKLILVIITLLAFTVMVYAVSHTTRISLHMDITTTKLAALIDDFATGSGFTDTTPADGNEDTTGETKTQWAKRLIRQNAKQYILAVTKAGRTEAAKQAHDASVSTAKSNFNSARATAEAEYKDDIADSSN